jgi:predicted metal-dependent phosphoesterase TrpH
LKAIDLHTHSTRSDGSYSPSELIKYAAQKGLSAIALTDHDTVAGLDEASACAADEDIEFVPGIEFSTEYNKRDVHIVGLYISYDSPGFNAWLDEFVQSRIVRNRKMCDNLRIQAGIDISFDRLTAEYPGSVITRAHYADYLIKHGYVKCHTEAFDRFLGDHTRYFIPREKVTPEKAIDLILNAGGVPILAHPILYHMSDENLDLLVSRCRDAGLMGIEALYSTYKPADERQITRLARKYGLLISGGSDFHGTNKPGLDLGSGYGHLFVPEDILGPIREASRDISGRK